MKSDGKSYHKPAPRSPSSRRAWIEMLITRSMRMARPSSPSSRRAWIEMYLKAVARFSPVMSPSSRRAWIEIDDCPELIDYAPCRPPRGGRGLKFDVPVQAVLHHGSPSSRRAWIEISDVPCCSIRRKWSPSSRRAWIEITSRGSTATKSCRRPPRGGRGLKSHW